MRFVGVAPPPAPISVGSSFSSNGPDGSGDSRPSSTTAHAQGQPKDSSILKGHSDCSEKGMWTKAEPFRGIFRCRSGQMDRQALHLTVHIKTKVSIPPGFQ